DRARIRQRAAYVALDLARRVAAGLDPAGGPAAAPCQEVRGNGAHGNGAHCNGAHGNGDPAGGDSEG
ncbi:MAG: hypothetical protein CMH59_01150, partial [Myxococcales bacterium]|nr:hypothetical protein [Myxococcales bacterium]HJK90693.1 hypothetical protein [Polyangiaceae bacterium LLY-WYZ-15_(1-7)]